MADTQAKKILTGRWADSGDRTDPDDTSLSPALVRTDGWPPSFSSSETPRRAVINQRFRELDGIAFDTMTMGILPWDGDIDYVAGAVVNELGVLYSADVATGPATSNATDPATSGQAVWSRVSGEVSAPSAPSAPIALTHVLDQIEWYWDCPLDGGAQVSGFYFQWREAGQQAWSARIDTDYAWYILAVAGSTAVQARVKAVNSEGESPWSAVGSGTAMSVDTPGRPTGLAGEPEQPLIIDWSWDLVTDNGGARVISYDFRWRPAGGQWATTTVTQTYARMTAADASVDIQAQVRARNSEGTGSWSVTEAATPIAADVPIPDPVADTPGMPTGLAGEPEQPLIIDWAWNLVTDNGGAIVDNYDFWWRAAGSSGSWTTTTVTKTYARMTAPDASDIEARVRARNSAGAGSWSATEEATPIAADPPAPGDTAPGMPTGLEGTPVRPLIVDWDWDLVTDDGGAPVTSYDLQWRYSGDGWSGNVITDSRTHASHAIANTGTGVQARVRARNAVGSSSWSGTITVNAADLLGSIPQSTRRTTNYSWPYPDVDRAVLHLVSGGLARVATVARTSTSASGCGEGGLSDGTTAVVR